MSANILRIFATDGFTPERVFRWSVDQTAEHLCERQLLWVTRLDGPWKPLVDWFVKHPSFRGVVLDPADRWEWNLEHEVTWRLAQGLYFKGEELDALCWIHDDMAPPECQGFKDWVKEWLVSESNAMLATAYQLWNDFDTVRADEVGISFASDLHCWLAKWRPDLAWLREPAGAIAINRKPFTPLGADAAESPWPFRHAKGVDRNFREHNGFTRRGFPTERWRITKPPLCVPYDPQATWREFKACV